MRNKRIEFNLDDDYRDRLDAIINNLNEANNGNNDNDSNNDPIKRQPTIVDEYLETLKLRRQIAYTLFKGYLVELLKDRADPSVIKEASAMIGMFLGIGDRWSNEVLKNAINSEIGIYGGFASKLMPDYAGDPIANYERSLSIGTKDDTAILVSNLLQLLGVNLTPEIVDKLVKMFKNNIANKQ